MPVKGNQSFSIYREWAASFRHLPLSSKDAIVSLGAMNCAGGRKDLN